MIVTVDARSRLSYGYFYLLGVPGPVRFAAGGFEGIAHVDPFRTVLPLLVDDRRVVIDLGDSSQIHPDIWQWAEVYGKVNCTADQVASGVIAIGPGFGVRPKSLRALWHTLRTPMPLEGVKAGVAERRNLWFRSAALAQFTPGVVEPDFLFSVGSLWEWQHTQETTNRLRAEWMRTARKMSGVRFEGGFVSRPHSELGTPRGPQEAEFADLLMPGRISISQWLDRTRRSFAVFNTPTVHGCHGWKLGQYLALGKAIVSTPISRELPSPLIHGKHLHVVKGPEEFSTAMELLRDDGEYRHYLEVNARQYWVEHLRPEVVFARLESGLWNSPRSGAPRRQSN